MKPHHLDEVPYFRIPPFVARSELEQKLHGVGLLPNSSVEEAIRQAELAHGNRRRNSDTPVLEEHIYPVGMMVLDYQLFEKVKGNPEFAETKPEGVIVGLTHDIFDDGNITELDFKRLFGERIFELVWSLTDLYYWKEGAISYQQKIEIKFKKMETSRWQTWAAGLADRLNNSLCFYTPPYIDESTGQPTNVTKRQLTRDKNLVLPFAKEKSPDFFYPMFNELSAYYRIKYPSLKI